MSPHLRLLPAAAAVVMTLGALGCSQPPAPASASPANISDIDVTEHVKTALHQTDSLKGIDITVITVKGDVRLSGMLDNQTQIDEALRIARAADGAHTIHDELTIRK